VIARAAEDLEAGIVWVNQLPSTCLHVCVLVRLCAG